MGRFRVSVSDVFGLKYNLRDTEERLRNLGMNDEKQIQVLAKDMRQSYLREAFIRKIYSQEGGNSGTKKGIDICSDMLNI